MRLYPTLMLVCILAPVPHSSTAADSQPADPLYQQLCASTVEQMNESERSGDMAALIGMTYPRGLTVNSPDGSVSMASLKQAADAWNSALGETIFRPAKPREKATVIARRVSKIGSKDDLQGMVAARTDERGHVTAKILVCSCNGNRALSRLEVGSVVTHEFGHLLGLDDAPDGVRPGTYIMDGFDPNHVVLKPATAEVAAVKQLRTQIRNDLVKIEVAQP